MKPSQPSPEGLGPSDESTERRAALLGLVAAAWVSLVFCYPARAFPLQSLILHLVAAAAALVLGVGLLRGSMSPASLRSILPVLLLAFLAIWTWIRWRTFLLPSPGAEGELVRVTSPGRHGVATALWAAVLGFLGWWAALAPGIGGRTFWRTFTRGMTVAAGAFAVYGLLQYFVLYDANRRALEESLSHGITGEPLMMQSLLHAFEEKRIGGRLGNGNVFAAQLAVFLVFTGIILDRRSRMIEPLAFRWVADIAFVLGGIVFFLTQSRGGVLTFGLVGGSLCLLAVRRLPLGNPAHTRRIVAGIIGGTLLLASIAALFLRERLSNTSTIQERFNYWRVASSVWARHPIIGSGPGTYELLYPSLKPPTARESKFAHSWILQTGAETGIIGVAALAILFGLLSAPVVAELIGKNTITQEENDAGLASERNLQRVRLSLACAALGFNGLFEYSLQTREFWLVLGFLAGAVGGLSERESDSTPSPRADLLQPMKPLLAALIFVLSIGGAWLTTPESLAEFSRWQAQLFSEDERHDEAAMWYRRAVNSTPDNAALVASEAIELFYVTLSSGRFPTKTLEPKTFERSRELLAEARRLNPFSPFIAKMTALFLQTLGDMQGAMEERNRAVALYPNDAGYRIERANFALTQGDEATARADHKFIVENGLPIWEFQRPSLYALRERLRQIAPGAASEQKAPNPSNP